MSKRTTTQTHKQPTTTQKIIKRNSINKTQKRKHTYTKVHKTITETQMNKNTTTQTHKQQRTTQQITNNRNKIQIHQKQYKKVTSSSGPATAVGCGRPQKSPGRAQEEPRKSGQSLLKINADLTQMNADERRLTQINANP